MVRLSAVKALQTVEPSLVPRYKSARRQQRRALLGVSSCSVSS
jgi:hypothetical protein